MLIYGINPVLEALRARRVAGLRVSSRADNRVRQIEQMAAEQGVPLRRVSAEEIERAAGGSASRHQGVVADVADTPVSAGSHGLEDLIAVAPDVPLIVVLDGIEDPHNVGAILRWRRSRRPGSGRSGWPATRRSVTMKSITGCRRPWSWGVRGVA